MKKPMYISSIIIMAVLLTVIFQTALAATSTWNGTVGGVSVQAQKTLLTGTNGWTTYLYSRADQNINIIGYTYWTLEQYCISSGSTVFWTNYSGDYDTNDSYYSTSAYITYRTCSGQSRYKSHGNHDFANGSQHKYPYVTVTVTR
jgi:hypothetical protein